MRTMLTRLFVLSLLLLGVLPGAGASQTTCCLTEGLMVADTYRVAGFLADVKALTGKAPLSFQGRYGFQSQPFRVPFQLAP